MAESLEWHRVLHRLDAYLDVHNRSEDATDHARNVMTRFEFMVSLATERALNALPLPADDCQAEATVLPFPYERPSA